MIIWKEFKVILVLLSACYSVTFWRNWWRSRETFVKIRCPDWSSNKTPSVYKSKELHCLMSQEI